MLKHSGLPVRMPVLILLACLALSGSADGAYTNAPAATFVVNTTADNDINGDGLCTLREAIIAANLNASYHDCAWAGSPNDTITFTITGTIRLGSALPPLTSDGRDLTIDGPGASLLTISGDSDGDGTGETAIFTSAAPNFTLKELALTDGYTDGVGGAVAIQPGSTMTSIQDCVFSANIASTGGAIYHAGGNLFITNSQIRDNQAAQGGGLYLANGNNNILDSLVSGNRADTGGGIYHYSNNLSISSTSVYSNTASGQGGGLYAFGHNVSVSDSTFQQNHAQSGGAVFREIGTLNISNSTFWGNQAEYGGALLNKGNVTINSSTFVANSASVNGGGLRNESATPVSVRNSIIANSLSGGNCSGVIANSYNNIDSGESCGWGAANGSLSNTDPLLGPLVNNGGKTLSMAPAWGSPAIDGVIYNAPNNCPSTDQRGMARPQGVYCDIGAVEFSWRRLYLPVVARAQ